MLEDREITGTGSGPSAIARTALPPPSPYGYSGPLQSRQKPFAGLPGHFESPTEKREVMA